MSEQKEDSFDDTLKKAKELFSNLADIKREQKASINSNIEDILKHLAYKTPAFDRGEILEVIPNGPYQLPRYVVFARYALPSDTVAITGRSLFVTEEEDIIVCVGLTRENLGVYATVSSRCVRRAEDA